MVKPPIPPRRLSAIAGVIAAGLLTGWSLPSSWVPTSTPGGEADQRSKPSRSRPSGAEAGDSHSLHSLLKLTSNRLPPEARSALESLSTERLKALLLEMSEAKPAGKRTAGQKWNFELRRGIAEELVRRDLTAAIQWSKEQTPLIVSSILMAGLRSDPAGVIALEKRKPESIGYLSMAVTGARERGADAVLEVESLFGKNFDTRFNTGQGVYPDGFDFTRYVTASFNQNGLVSAVGAWAGKDPDQAFLTVRDRFGKTPSLMGALVDGVAAVQGEEAAAKWIAGKLTELPPDQRQQAAASLAPSFLYIPQRVGLIARANGMSLWNQPLSTERVAAIMTALPDSSDRVGFATSVLDTNYSSVLNPRGLQALQALDSEELQSQALVKAMAAKKPGEWGSNETVRKGLEETMQKLSFSEAAKARLREQLPLK